MLRKKPVIPQLNLSKTKRGIVEMAVASERIERTKGQVLLIAGASPRGQALRSNILQPVNKTLISSSKSKTAKTLNESTTT